MRRLHIFDKDAHTYIRYIASQRLGLGAMICRMQTLENGKVHAAIPRDMTAEDIRHFAWHYVDDSCCDAAVLRELVEYLQTAIGHIMLIPAGTARSPALPAWLPTILAHPQTQGHFVERYISPFWRD